MYLFTDGLSPPLSSSNDSSHQSSKSLFDLDDDPKYRSTSYTSNSDTVRPSFIRKRSNSLNQLSSRSRPFLSTSDSIGISEVHCNSNSNVNGEPYDFSYNSNENFLNHQREQQSTIHKPTEAYYTSDKSSSPSSDKQLNKQTMEDDSSSATSSNNTSNSSLNRRRHTFSGREKRPLFIDFKHPIVPPSISNLMNNEQSPPTKLRASILKTEDDHLSSLTSDTSHSNNNKVLASEPLPQMPAALPTPEYRRYHRPHGQSSEYPPFNSNTNSTNYLMLNEPSTSISSNTKLPSIRDWQNNFNKEFSLSSHFDNINIDTLNSSNSNSNNSNANIDKKLPGRKRKVGNQAISTTNPINPSSSLIANSRLSNHDMHTSSQALAALSQDIEYANSDLGKSANMSTPSISHQSDLPSTTASNGSKGKVYTCQYCLKTFNRPSSLKIHTYSHTGERPFVCTVPGCNRSFSVASNLKRHTKVHNNNNNNNNNNNSNSNSNNVNNVTQQYENNNNDNKIGERMETDKKADDNLVLNKGKEVEHDQSRLQFQRSNSNDGITSSGSGDGNGSGSGSGSGSSNKTHGSGGAGEYADAEDNSSSSNDVNNNNNKTGNSLVPAENHEMMDEEEKEDDSVKLAKDVTTRKKNQQSIPYPHPSSDVLDRSAALIDGKLKSTM